MKIIDYIEDNFPDYALSYAVNGDASGIEPEDVEACDAWLSGCEERLRKLYPDALAIELLFEDGEGSFVRCPAFGLACNAVQCAVAVFVDNEDTRDKLALPWEEEEEEES